MKISIIVPVYNAGKYLDECIESVRKQSYKDWELLLVDDGSDDGSREKCIAYADKDSRIRTFFNNHGGVSSARNVALEKALGEYYMFMDNDDYWEENNLLRDVIEQIKAQECDMLMFGCTEFWPDGKKKPKPQNIDMEKICNVNKADAIKYCVEKDILTRAVWTKAIKREIFTANGLRFPEGKRNEDVYVTGELLRYVKKIGWCNTGTYMYRKGTGVSQSDQKPSQKIIDDLKDMCIDYIETINRSDESKELKEAYLSYIAYPYAVWMMHTSQVKPKNKRDIQLMKKYSNVLEIDVNPYMKLIKKAYMIVGFEMTIRLLGIYDKIRKLKG